MVPNFWQGRGCLGKHLYVQDKTESYPVERESERGKERDHVLPDIIM